jgi:ubiquinone/menaquinone biosynthesis C-methylase UbiE
MVQGQRPSVSVNSSNVTPHSIVARAFDGIAPIFDSTLENETTRRLRAKLYSVIDSLLKPASTILDITCGTGIDALHLARQGYQVFGTDISEQMIELARSKAEKEHAMNVKFRVASYDTLSPNVVPMADMVLSNFGGLNCTSDLASAARAIETVTNPGGNVVAVIMPPFSLWETVSYIARFEWRNASRRLRASAPSTGFIGTTFPVYYYTPQATTTAFSPYFERIQIVGLSIVSPTPQSTRFVNRHPTLARTLVAIDGCIETVPFFRSAGDHYIIVLKKKQ